MKTIRYLVIIPEIKNHLCASETETDFDDFDHYYHYYYRYYHYYYNYHFAKEACTCNFFK